MEKDSAENRAVTGKLINGHTDWNLIEKALMSNDSLVLNEPIKTNTLSHTAATSNTIHSKATKKNMESTSKPSEDVIYSLVNQSPKYPGGDAGLFQWLRQHIKYPRIARENNIEGKVYVGFVVETDGSITNVDVKRGIGSGCNDEAVRVISSMPKWTPGFKDGKAVRVAYTLPIIFKLE